MNKCSFFIKNKALFGSYPNPEQVNELQSIGVKYFVNLTLPLENLLSYQNNYIHYIEFPIQDRKYPTDRIKFAIFILSLTNIIYNLKKDEKIYIHCKGGHGRAGIVVASLLCELFKIPPQQSLALTTQYHSDRQEMRPKWREIGSPQTKGQKIFVINMFKPLVYFKALKSGPTLGFSNFSDYPVNIPDLGTFKNAEAAYQAHKGLDNEEYLAKLKNCSPHLAKQLGSKIKLPINWHKIKEKVMYTVLYNKVMQNDAIQENLLKSGLRIIYFQGKDIFWGGENNMLGKIWMKIRTNLFNNKMNNE